MVMKMTFYRSIINKQPWEKGSKKGGIRVIQENLSIAEMLNTRVRIPTWNDADFLKAIKKDLPVTTSAAEVKAQAEAEAKQEKPAAS